MTLRIDGPGVKGKKAFIGIIVGIIAIAGLGSLGQHSQQTDNATQPPASSQSATQIKGTDTVAPAAPAPTVDTKTVTSTEAIPFQAKTINDATAEWGKQTVTPGENGEKTITYQVTLTNGTETSRTKTSEQITKQPVDQVTKIGTKAAQPVPSHAAAIGPSCPNGTYVNSSGQTICRPYESDLPPSGASARCKDGSYSFSQSRRGTCSGHGGVSIWY